MTETSLPWEQDAGGDDGPYSDDVWAELYRRLFTGTNRPNAGVLDDTGNGTVQPLHVSESSPAAASVDVAPGAALVEGKYYQTTATETLSINANISGNDRIDLVILRSDYAAQTIRLAVLEGTPAATPVVPSVTQTDGVLWEIPLAEVYVSNGFATITDSNITRVERRIGDFNGREGLRVSKLTASTLAVGAGRASIGPLIAQLDNAAELDLATASDWLDGATAEEASHFVHVYINEAGGQVKLHNKWPSYTRPNTNGHIATADVDQAGWDGTAGNGLDATTITYDNGSDVADAQPGMWLGVFGSGDTDYSTGRGRGSGAGADNQYWSWAKITAVNTGANQITVEAGHQIAIHDNDKLLVVPGEPILYREENSLWYRWVGSLWNDGSSDLTDYTAHSAEYTADEGSDYTTTSSSFVDVDSTNWSFTIATQGEDVALGFRGSVYSSVSGQNRIYFDVVVDGVRLGGDDGLIAIKHAEVVPPGLPMPFEALIRDLPAGMHTLTLQWKNTFNTAAIFAGAGTSGGDLHPQFWVKGRSDD